MQQGNKEEQSPAQPIQQDNQHTWPRSAMLSSYIKIMGQAPPYIRRTHKKAQLSKHGIFFKPDEPWSPFKYELIQILNDYQVLEVRVHMGHYEIALLLLNQDRKFNIPEGLSQKGESGHVCSVQIDGQEFAIKVIDTTRKKAGKIISDTIQEYSIHLISSALGCGPVVRRDLGFDLIVYSNCVLFASEKGYPLKSRLTDFDLSQLLSDVNLLHAYGIVHCDLKIENLVFSTELGKFVLVDYGLSRVLEEPFGAKSKTRFRGTPGYCCQDMFELCSPVVLSGMVDLYYNDAHCLEEVGKRVENVVNLSTVLNENKTGKIVPILGEPSVAQVRQLCSLSLIKYKLLMCSNQEVKTLLESGFKEVLDCFGPQVLNFMKRLMPYLKNQKLLHTVLLALKADKQYEQLLRNLNYHFKRMPLQETPSGSSSLYTDTAFHQRFVGPKVAANHLATKAKMLEFIREVRNFEKSKQRYIRVVIQLLRFDVKNITTEQKIDLSMFIKKELKVKSEGNGGLAEIKELVLYLVDSCLSDLEQSKCQDNFECQQNIFILLSQGELLDCNLLPDFTRLQAHLASCASLYFERTFSVYFFLLCFQFQMTFRLCSSHQADNYKMARLIDALYINIYQNIQQLRPIDPYHALMVRLLNNFSEAQTYFCQDEFRLWMQQLSQISCPRLRMRGIMLLHYHQLRWLHNFQSYRMITLVFDSLIKECLLHPNHVSFFVLIKFKLLVLASIEARSELPTYLSQVQEVIGCPQIFQDLIFSLLVYLNTELSNEKQEHTDHIPKIIHLCQNRLETDPTTVIGWCHLYLEKLQYLGGQFLSKNRESIQQIYQTLCLKKMSLVTQIQPYDALGHYSMFSFFVWFSHINIYRLFAVISPEYRSAFDRLIEAYQQKWNYLESLASIAEEYRPQMTIVYYRLLITSGFYYINRNQLQKSLKNFENLFVLSSSSSDLKFLKQMAFEQIKIVGLACRQTEKVNEYTRQYYKESCQTDSFLGYLNSCSPVSTITLTFHLLLHQQPEFFCGYFQKLSLELGKYPLKGFFQYLLWSMEFKFLQDVKSLSQIKAFLTFDIYCKYFQPLTWQNRFDMIFLSKTLQKSLIEETELNLILKKMALGFDRLPIYARTMLVRNYYMKFLTKTLTQRQKIHLVTRVALRHMERNHVKDSLKLCLNCIKGKANKLGCQKNENLIIKIEEALTELRFKEEPARTNYQKTVNRSLMR